MADRSMVKVAPTSEKGSATGIPVMGILSWAAMGQQVGNDLEYVPELQWPSNVFTYQKMRNDSQVDGLLNGSFLPISRWSFGIDPNSAPDIVVQELCRDVGLPVATRTGDTWRMDEQAPIPRHVGRFDFHEHLGEALMAVAYGHEYFEINADLAPPPDGWPIDTPLRARLRKLATRPPWTITAIDTNPDGGLRAIRQLTTPPGDPGIPVEALVAYIWGKEGANWVGRSMLRSCYRPWLVKDRVMRVGAINIERNGAGVPMITAPQGATVGQIKLLEDLARRIRAGDSSGGAVPYGSQLQLMGVIGSQPDAIGMMNFLNEEMARSFLQMVQSLGTSRTGSRALGMTFLNMMEWLLEAICNWFCAVFNKIVIERWMFWNFGAPQDANIDEYAPRLVYAPRGKATDGLQQGVQNGNIQVDQQTAAMIEEPDEEPVHEHAHRPSRNAAGGHGGRARRRRAASQADGLDSPIPLPARPLSRQPNVHEIAAAVDFAQMDATFQAALDLLEADVRSNIRTQVEELHDAIIEAGGDLAAITEISATPIHSEVIRAQVVSVAQRAAQEAVNEATRQGATVELPALDDLLSSLAARSEIVDRVITRDVTDAAVRRAVRMTGGSLPPEEVAGHVRDELHAMTWVGVRDTLGGAVQGSQNAGRGLVFRRDGAAGFLYASEILDDRTCDLCDQVDGTQYTSMDDAERDYPFGGFVDCLGGGRCRGTVVKVYETENPA